MTEKSLPKVLWLLLFGSLFSAGADVVGLQQQIEVKISAPMAGAPFESEIPPSVWAMSFSPNGEYLAFGVQFVQGSSYPSYLLLVSPEKPGIVLKKFEVPRHPAMRNVSTITWSRDSRYLAITPYRDWDQAAVVDLTENRLHVVPDRLGMQWCGGAAGLLSGPLIVQQCTPAGRAGSEVRFLGLDGAPARTWAFPGTVSLLDISPDGTMLALDLWGSPGAVPVHHLHDVSIFNISDRAEIRRWSLPEATKYSGRFAESGTTFCTEPTLNSVRSTHEWVCRNIASGSETLRRVLPRGVGDVRVIANRLIVNHDRMVLLPFTFFGTDHVVTRTDHELWDLQTGKKVASWRINTQLVLPKLDVGFQSTVSPDGGLVALGGSGILRVFRLSP